MDPSECGIGCLLGTKGSSSSSELTTRLFFLGGAEGLGTGLAEGLPFLPIDVHLLNSIMSSSL